jgi:hypothetical protein
MTHSFFTVKIKKEEEKLILNSKIRIFLIAGLLALLVPVLAFAQNSVMRRGDVVIKPNITVYDIVAADGDLAILGRVKGSVFLVNGNASLSPNSLVEGNLTVLGGDLTVNKGAGVTGEINVFAGKAHIADGSAVSSEVKTMEEVPALTDEKLALISRYIIFDRPKPDNTFLVTDFFGLDLSSIKMKKVKEDIITRLNMYELGRIPFDVEELEGPIEIQYWGDNGRAKVALVVFKTPKAAEDFWDMLRNSFEDKVNHSVHNSLGDGAHWFFRYRGTTYCLWYKGEVFHAVMVRHEDSSPEKDEWEQVEMIRDEIISKLRKMY